MTITTKHMSALDHGCYDHGACSRLEQGDRQLLERFIVRRDEAAFSRLVERHGRAVGGVCRRLLRHEQDAEDATQAVFLTLARNAATIRQMDAVGGWLYGTACRISRKLRRSAARRQRHERRAEPLGMQTLPPWNDAAWREFSCILDKEVRRLAETRRLPFILCCMDGMSSAEAAERLGWNVATVASRLASARRQLRRRLKMRMRDEG